MFASLSGLIAALGPFLQDVAEGAVTTIAASVAAFVLGVAIGSLLLPVRQHGGRALAAVVILYVSVIRGTPALIQMLVAYYVLPSVLNLPLSPLQAGLRYLPFTVGSFFVAGATASLEGKVPPRVMLAAGLAITALGLVLMSGAKADDPWTVLLPGFVIGGLGVGLVNPVLANVVLSTVPERNARRKRDGASSGKTSESRSSAPRGRSRRVSE